MNHIKWITFYVTENLMISFASCQTQNASNLWLLHSIVLFCCSLRGIWCMFWPLVYQLTWFCFEDLTPKTWTDWMLNMEEGHQRYESYVLEYRCLIHYSFPCHPSMSVTIWSSSTSLSCRMCWQRLPNTISAVFFIPTETANTHTHETQNHFPGYFKFFSCLALFFFKPNVSS